MNSPDSEETKLFWRIVIILALIGFVLASILRLVVVPSITEKDLNSLKITALLFVIYFMSVTSILLPMFVISRNENLKNVIENTVNNMLPVIYIPNVISNVIGPRSIDVNV